MRQNLQTLSTERSDMNDKFKYSDEKLILRFQEGDINAYNELVKRYKDRLLNFVLRYFNNVELYRQIPFLNFASYNLLSKIIIFLWTIFITIGIWRSAEAYKGKIIWIIITLLLLSYRVFSLRLLFF